MAILTQPEPGQERRTCLLLAMPQLADPNFQQTVSLMVSFDSTGAFGLILNRPTEITAQQILSEKIKLPQDGAFPVFFGGPVQVNSLWFLHGYSEFKKDSIIVSEDLFITTDLVQVERVLAEKHEDPQPKFRFILGYSGWSPGQLEKEIAFSSWVTGPVDADEIFSTPAQDLWLDALHRIGIPDPNTLVTPVTSGEAN